MNFGFRNADCGFPNYGEGSAKCEVPFRNPQFEFGNSSGPLWLNNNQFLEGENKS